MYIRWVVNRTIFHISTNTNTNTNTRVCISYFRCGHDGAACMV